ncbi:D-alanine--poly(phosphoribitol) ligase subunit DltA [Carnobacterium gallinarum]|uniref:D-alanine--poly(phosphoribitol) ligase subunit DltA n=1 Tax=Carnobacterium gallinarum TaxID=2749 RepID=UPI0005562106|nr:D-alanine--poly(phosphoribitol) ligase subunit DltA [Carnobacterium gallinarum]
MNQTIIERLDQLAQTTPSAAWYDYNGEQSTYEDLKIQSDRVALYLGQELHLTEKSPILVFGALEAEMIVAFISAIKAGHAYIPVDSHTPRERLEQIISIAKPDLIIGMDELPIELDESMSFISKIELNEISQRSTNQVLDPAKAVTGNNNFYIIFTSGTTGVPKGVQISHDNLVSFTDWMFADFEIEGQQRFLAQAPYSFDLSVMDLYPALLSGSTLVPLEKEITNNFKQLFTTLPTLAVTVWVSTPSFVNICLMDQNFTQSNYPDLKTFLFCGEELQSSTAILLNQRFPESKVFNTYGPTEATVAITETRITSDITESYPRLPIGKVKKDTKVILVDEELHPVPAGEAGEIVIIGPSVSKGYLNNPEKTVAAFYEVDGVPAYRTGDLGKFEGELLFYQGRLDFQIKLHGYRIELEDIDHNIEQVSYVKAATVVPKLKEHKAQSLVAYVVAHPHSFEKDFQLTNAIKQELAPLIMDYMMPTKWIYVDHLPLTANGKVDRKGLMNEVNQ